MKTNQPQLDIHGHSNVGDYIQTVQLESSCGMTASILTLGARLIQLCMPDGTPLTLSFQDLPDVQADSAYIGAVIGRTANRIRAGRFTALPQVDQNAHLQLNEQNSNGEYINNIHGGRNGWTNKLFSFNKTAPNQADFHFQSPNQDQGFPSAVQVSVHYSLQDSGLSVSFSTSNIGSVPTVSNLTLHPYFDLSGHGGQVKDSVLDYIVHAPLCTKYLPLDGNNVPTGEIADVAGTYFDFLQPRKIDIGNFTGYDQYWVLGEEASNSTTMKPLVTVRSPAHGDKYGVEMQVLSDQPGFQMYTSNGFDGSGTGNFQLHGSLAIEPSGFIDAGNNSNFPTIILEPGSKRQQHILYKFRALDSEH